jgi:hypothetical protein
VRNGWHGKGAFVTQFRPETELEEGRFEGRVEHVASSRAAHFHSLDGLVAFMAQVLSEVRAASEAH